MASVRGACGAAAAITLVARICIFFPTGCFILVICGAIFSAILALCVLLDLLVVRADILIHCLKGSQPWKEGRHEFDDGLFVSYRLFLRFIPFLIRGDPTLTLG